MDTVLATTRSVMADDILAMDESGDFSNLWDTEAGQAALAVDAEAIAFCRAAEAEFDERDQQALAEDVLWVPDEMKEVVRVAFYCDRSDRP